MTSSAGAATTISWCTTCRADMPFEQPDCVDGHGHGIDCPEWACVGCGEAVVVAFGVTEPVRRSSGRQHAADHASHVA